MKSRYRTEIGVWQFFVYKQKCVGVAPPPWPKLRPKYRCTDVRTKANRRACKFIGSGRIEKYQSPKDCRKLGKLRQNQPRILTWGRATGQIALRCPLLQVFSFSYLFKRPKSQAKPKFQFILQKIGLDRSKVRSGMTGCAGEGSFYRVGAASAARRAAKQGLRKGLVILLPRRAQPLLFELRRPCAKNKAFLLVA